MLNTQTAEETAVQLTSNSLNVQDFAQAVHAQHFLIRDFIADPRDIRTFTDEGGTLLSLRGRKAKDSPDGGDDELFPMKDWAHSQVAEFCGIPMDYYKRMQATQHGLLDTSVRTWLDSQAGKPRMVRTLDGKVRAMLSNRYRRIDNYDVANTILPVLIEAGASFRRLHVSEESMVIQAVFTEKRADVRVGDTIMLGVTIENNEVGKGMVSVLPMSLTLNCMNGATHNTLGHKRQHVGTKLGGDGDPTEFYKDDTLKAADTALMLQLRDVTAKAADDVMLHTIVAEFQRALQIPVTAPAPHAVAELARTGGLSESEAGGVLEHFMRGNSSTQWGMVQAITRMAQDVPDGGRAHELETLGGNILDMAAAEFAPIAGAGAPKARRGGRR